MDLSQYLTGKGADVSRKPVLEINKKCSHFFVEPDNFYSLRNFADFESLDFIYSKNLINDTKFFKIIIKEWFYFCKVGGHIVIEIKPNKILNFEQLLKECEFLLDGKIEILGKKLVKNRGLVVIKKTKSALEKADSIDKWTFGIISDGKRKEAVDNEIDSIINLKIPHFEILICGNYNPVNKKNVRHIPFNPKGKWINYKKTTTQKSKLYEKIGSIVRKNDVISKSKSYEKVGWMTRKKNIICKNAKYENLVITHDRFTFDKNWFKGMKKYGNYFEVMSCIILGADNKRSDDWVTFGVDLNSIMGNHGLLNYRDWDKNGYISGGFYILKKSVWRKCKWDENLGFGQTEDFALSKDFHENGVVARLNPFCLCKTFNSIGWYVYKLNKKRAIGPKDKPILRRINRYIKKIYVGYRM